MNRLHITLHVLCSLLLMFCISIAAAAEVDGPRGKHPLRPAKAGDFCIRCGITHEHIETVLQYKGRWMAVCPACTDFVLASVDSFDYYFDELEPRGALFQEHDGQINESSFSWGWFLLGLFHPDEFDYRRTGRNYRLPERVNRLDIGFSWDWLPIFLVLATP